MPRGCMPVRRLFDMDGLPALRSADESTDPAYRHMCLLFRLVRGDADDVGFLGVAQLASFR